MGFFYVLIFCIALILGSIYDLLAFRLIKKVNIFKRCFCDKCEKQITFIYLIPILGYLLTLGKCKQCKQKISIVHPLVELFTGIFALTYFYLYFNNHIDLITLIMVLFLTSYLILMTLSDLYYKELPDSIHVVMLLFCIVVIFFIKDYWNSIYGMLTGFTVTFLIALIGYKMTNKIALGGGDIKLFTIIGFFVGPVNIFIILFLASFIGLIFSMFIKHKDEYIPFVPSIAIATLVVFWYGRQLIDLYLGMF